MTNCEDCIEEYLKNISFRGRFSRPQKTLDLQVHKDRRKTVQVSGSSRMMLKKYSNRFTRPNPRFSIVSSTRRRRRRRADRVDRWIPSPQSRALGGDRRFSQGRLVQARKRFSSGGGRRRIRVTVFR